MKKITLLLISIATYSCAHAQTASSGTQTLSFGSADNIAITFTGTGTNAGTTVSLPFASVADYANGIASTAQQLQVSSNKNFTVSVNASASTFSYSGAASPAPTMPVNGVLALEISANATGGAIASPFSASSYAPITSSPQPVLSNCTLGTSQLFSVNYQATPGFSYPSGTYTVNVIYTATQL